MEPLAETAEALRQLARHGEAGFGVELYAMAERVRSLVPELVGLSLAVVEEGVTFTLLSSTEQLAALDATQYLEGGPCVADIEQAEPLEVDISELLDEDHWQLFAQASASFGVASTLSLPVLEGDRAIGGVNLYASSGNAFTGKHEQVAEALGSDARLAVSNADLSFRSLQRARQAPGHLRDQGDIDIAVGIISERQHLTIPAARELLGDAANRADVEEVQAARIINRIRPH